MTSDTERLESVEVMRNKTGRDGCSRRAWNNERCVMSCGNRDLPIQLFGTEFATLWPMFEFLSAILEANFMAFINTKGVRVTGSQTCDLFEVSHAMKVAITSLSILKMQVIFRWTFNFINDWFQSPRPPETCHLFKWNQVSTYKNVLAHCQLEDNSDL